MTKTALFAAWRRRQRPVFVARQRCTRWSLSRVWLRPWRSFNPFFSPRNRTRVNLCESTICRKKTEVVWPIKLTSHLGALLHIRLPNFSCHLTYPSHTSFFHLPSWKVCLVSIMILFLWGWGQITVRLIELRSFCPMAFAMTLVDSPDDTRHSTTWWISTIRDVILVTLGFHMCSHWLSMLIPFFQF